MIDETALVKYGPAEVPDASSVYSFRVHDAQSEALAVQFAGILHKEIKGFEAGKAEVVDPQYQVYKRGLAWFMDRINPRKKAREHLRKEIEDYRARQRASVQQSLAVATSHAEVSRAVEAVVARPEGLSEREEWTFVVDDPNQLPREFMRPDQAKLDAFAEMYKASTAIPGGRAVLRKVPILR